MAVQTLSPTSSIARLPTSAISKVKDALSLAHLITESNIKAYVLPVVLFAMLSLASGGVTVKSPSWADVAASFPRALLYIWLYVFHFDLSNQKDPESVEEDKINKPWRAIPSGRLSIEDAQKWYVVATVLLLVASIALGGFPEALAFMAETWVYDYVGASSWWGKNIINALFYSTGQLGATRVASHSNSMARAGYEWCALLGLNTLTTVQIQDFRDIKGDGARGRRTLPLAMGDVPCRFLTAFFIVFWSMALCAYWQCTPLEYIMPVMMGGYVSFRLLFDHSTKADRMTFHIYTLGWLPILYSIPFVSKLGFLRFGALN
ncbi:Fumagillin beta-trans-bergamotene synthase [Colletotrichum siamense]|uniref:Fumagillin beta-trans-bergamotene synthase n=1 Tax=Colletotrichum siamense TaxID=690259 RepID=A0A9P5ENS3_COLSI|nr:Fumagillin beta-trans-bergamotene synthase [Colletotrichum siamense]KAF4855696.1 Fumagillin beta-trans-bergamotene synthase [Colletotrichum siamense]